MKILLIWFWVQGQMFCPQTDKFYTQAQIREDLSRDVIREFQKPDEHYIDLPELLRTGPPASLKDPYLMAVPLFLPPNDPEYGSR